MEWGKRVKTKHDAGNNERSQPDGGTFHVARKTTVRALRLTTGTLERVHPSVT